VRILAQLSKDEALISMFNPSAAATTAGGEAGAAAVGAASSGVAAAAAPAMDVYRAMAAQIFPNTRIEDVSKSQRTIAKTIVLGSVPKPHAAARACWVCPVSLLIVCCLMCVCVCVCVCCVPA